MYTNTVIFRHELYRVGQKQDQFYKCITPVYDDVRRGSIYQNVQLFITRWHSSARVF